MQHMARNMQHKGQGDVLPHRGITTLVVILFMGIFFLVMSALTGYAFEQARYGRGVTAREQALSVAEAGLDYYKWYLGHNPSLMTGSGNPTSPYTYIVNDPESGSELGKAVVTATTAKQCGMNQWIDVSSKGTVDANTTYPRTISARYMAPSVATYAYILNTNVWFGSTNTGNGPYFSNGGIREDGANNSTVTSAQSTFTCDSTLGCSPNQTKPGVFGAGSGYRLWVYPASSINFAGMATNFSTLATYAQNSGIYLSGTATYVGGVQQGSSYSSVAGTDQKGYHLVFNANGTVTVYLVTGTNASTQGYWATDQSWHTEYDVITSQSLLGTYTPPSGCSLIYSNARTWVEGTVSGRVTVIAASTGSYTPDALLAGNITYATTDGTTGFTLVAEHSVRIPINSPDTMSIRGIFVAQTGYYGRDYYQSGKTGGYDSYILRTQLNVSGVIVSAQQGGLAWGSPVVSGYVSRSNSYDQILAFNPPPFTPSVSASYGYVLWQER
jgi:hypothetical protein